MNDLSRTRLTLSGPRYAGLTGAVLLALASATMHHRSAAVPLWFAGTVLLAGAWLLLGRRLGGVRVRWLVVTALLWAVPLLLSAPLESNDVYSYACQGALVSHGVDAYTHGVTALPCPWLHDVPQIWRHTPSPYGPLWLGIAGLAAATGQLTAAVVVFRVAALAGLALVAWGGHRVATALGADPVRAAWLGLASPLVLVHALSGAHNDAVLAGLTMAAFAVALTGRRTLVRVLVAGAVAGLAVAVKGTGLVALPFLVLLLVPDRSWWALVRTGAVTVVGAAGGYGLLWAATGYGLGWVPALQNTTRLIVETTSVPTGIGLVLAHGLKLAGAPGPAAHAVGVVRAVGLVVLVAVLVGLWLWARRRGTPRAIVPAAGVALAASVVLAPVAFPWYALTPLAVLGYGLVDDRVRWRIGVVVAVLALLILPNGNGLAGIYKVPGGIVDTLLVVAGLVAGYRWLRYRGRSHGSDLRTSTGTVH